MIFHSLKLLNMSIYDNLSFQATVRHGLENFNDIDTHIEYINSELGKIDPQYVQNFITDELWESAAILLTAEITMFHYLIQETLNKSNENEYQIHYDNINERIKLVYRTRVCCNTFIKGHKQLSRVATSIMPLEKLLVITYVEFRCYIMRLCIKASIIARLRDSSDYVKAEYKKIKRSLALRSIFIDSFAATTIPFLTACYDLWSKLNTVQIK